MAPIRFSISAGESVRGSLRGCGREFHGGRGIALDDFLIHQLARESAQAREMPTLRTDGETLVRQRFEVRCQRGGVELRGLEAGIAAP